MILCISHSKDFYTIDIVIRRLRELGKEVFRLDSDTFSHQLKFEYSFENEKVQIKIEHEGTAFSIDDIEAVYYRKLWHINVPDDLDDTFKSIYNQEYTTMRNLFFESLRKLPWMNPMELDHRIGENKLEQLSYARNAGLMIPETLFTNDPIKVKHFFYTVCKGNMIAKLHGSLSRSMKGDTPFFPTTRIQESDLDNLETLVYCPMIFQQNIEKRYELRIIYIDGTFFTGKINAQASETGKTDWRAAKDIMPSWEYYALPDSVCNALDTMMRNIGLYFGAIDMIRQEDGTYIFLEVNPQGEWGMIQRDLDYPIGETIAEKLVARIC
ncbi:MvdC/MvdD family ATP grasp protein [Flavobacterium cerinum]|uniref:ATP-grasp ribosomal peptide maturase n=1 Tax=Flavobacterium cerinum TaxID=2502784 RepID=A0ABY5INL1_9FLAO|nr:ATP-grasp ribosomal peptide maturase [Flavobacterium cerinum]UUC44334.1 ATP-grasp ribosomal peptide maturase [Flavobacterium cerinum]